MASRPRHVVLMLCPDPRHPGGVTRVIDTWIEGGLEGKVSLQLVPVAAWDAALPVQLAQTLGAYIRVLGSLLRPRRRPALAHIQLSVGPSVFREWLFARTFRLFRVPVVVSLHSGSLADWLGDRKLAGRAVADLLGTAAATVVPLNFWAPLAHSLGAKSVLVIPHGLPARIGDAAPVDPKSNRPEDTAPKTLLYFGRWAPVKGLDVLGCALAMLPAPLRGQLVVRIFGNGQRDWLVSQMQPAHDIRIEIENWLPDERKREELANCDAFVLPSRNEWFGQSLLEAMACGRPIIATSAGGIPEVLAGYPAYRLVAPGDAGGLSEAIAELVSGDWPAGHGVEPVKSLGEFEASRVTADLVGAYDELLERSSRSRDD